MLTNVTITLVTAVAAIGCCLLVWVQFKKYNVYKIKNKIRKLENDRAKVESDIHNLGVEMLKIPGNHRDTDIVWVRLHEQREDLNRRLLQQRLKLEQS